MAFWKTEYSSLLVAPQTSGFGTPNTTDADFKALLCDRPKFTPATEIQELELLTGVVGAAPERLVGRRSGTLTFSIPLEGLKAAYDPTAEDPGDAGVIPHWAALVGNALGSNVAAATTAANFWAGAHLSNSEYTASGVASATSTAITLDDATASDKIAAGELVATAASATTSTVQFGFAKAKAGQVVTLEEASGNTVNSASGNVYGTSTAWVSTACLSQIPCTFRWVGDDTTMAYVLADGICESVKITWESGQVGTVELSYKVYDFSINKNKGGLVAPASFARIPQFVGAVNGRSTVDGYATGGLEKCSLEFKVEVKEFKNHNAPQGIGTVILSKPRLTAQFSIPHQTTAPSGSTDVVFDAAGTAGVTGSYLWQSRLERGITTSIGAYVGSKVGKLFAFYIPAGRLVAVPSIEDRDGLVAMNLTIEASAYTGDSTDTLETTVNSPIDSIGRVGIG